MKLLPQVRYLLRLLVLLLPAMSVLICGVHAKAEKIYTGTNFDIFVSTPISLGDTPLMAVTLNAFGKTGARPTTFDYTRSAKGGTGITTVDGAGQLVYAMYQIWQEGAGSTPTNILNPDLESIPLEYDTHFLIPNGLSITSTSNPYENKSNTPPVNYNDYDYYGNVLRGTFSLMGATSTSWDFAYIVVPENTIVKLYFEIGAPGYASETINRTITITSVPEPGTFAMLAAGVFGLLVFFRRRKS